MKGDITQKEMDLIFDVCDHFEFEKVHKVMVALDWKWSTDEVNGVPELWQIKKAGRHACLCAIREKSYISGGWHATFQDGVLELMFVAEYWDSSLTRG